MRLAGIKSAVVITFLFAANCYSQESVPQPVLESTNAAAKLAEQGNYGGAVNEYQKIVDAYPATDYALKAQVSIALAHVKAKNETAADGAKTKLYLYEAKTEPMIKGIRDVALAWRKNNNPSKALAIYTELLSKYESSPQTIDMQAAIANCYFDMRDITRADAEFNKLLTEYKSSSEFVKVTFPIVFRYSSLRNYDKALETYRLLVRSDPNNPQAVLVQGAIVRTLLNKKDFAQAEKELQILQQNYSQVSAYKESACNVAYAYRTIIKEPARALEIYRGLLQSLKDMKEQANVHTSMIRTYLEMNDYSNANLELEVFLTRYKNLAEFIMLAGKLKTTFVKLNRFQESIEINKRLVSYFPEHKNAPRYVRQLAESYLEMNSDNSADACIEQLLTDYASHPDMVKEAMNLSDKMCSKYKDYNKALEIYTRILQADPNNAKAIHIKRGIIGAHLKMGNKEIADVQVETLRSEYSDNALLATVLNRLAYMYHQHYPSDSIKLYEYALAKAKTSNDFCNAYGGIAKIKVRLGIGEDPNNTAVNQDVDAIVEKLLSEYADSRQIAFHILQVGEEYYGKAENCYIYNNQARAASYYSKALQAWDKIINLTDDSHIQSFAYYESATVLRRMEQYTKAIEYFQQVVTKWPKFAHAWNAQFMIAKCAEKEIKINPEKKEQLLPVLIKACDDLVSKYPDSPVNEAAKRMKERYCVVYKQ